MSTKAKGVSCYDKASYNEELFVLRAQDITAPKTIIDWIGNNILTASDELLQEAFECALRMRKQDKKKFPI